MEQTLARLKKNQMLIHGVEGNWSVKDILAHISTWERWMIRWTKNIQQGKKPETPEPWDIDWMNADTYTRNKDRSLAKVLEEFHQSYWDSLFLIQNLSDVQMNTNYPSTWPMGLLWTGLTANTTWHYKEHRTNILKWIESF
jgi:hypothetical protein